MLEHGIYNMYAINTPTKKGPTILKNFPIAPNYLVFYKL